MCFFKQKSGFYLADASRKELRQLASRLVPEKPVSGFPELSKNLRQHLSGSFVTGSYPAVIRYQSEFEEIVGPFLQHDMRHRISSAEFERRLLERLNRFNRLADLPSVRRAGLVNGQVTSSLYKMGRYAFGDGSFGFHFQIEPATFISTVAHELTHMEQDYLVFCLLADIIGIDASFDDNEISEIIKLLEQNRTVRPNEETVRHYLAHRNGRALSPAQRARAELTLEAFRHQPYRMILIEDLKRADAVLPKRSWFRRTNYLAFWQALSPDKVPAGLRTSYLDALDYIARSGNESTQYEMARQFHRLLSYHRRELDGLIDYIEIIWQRHCFFEREAYAVSAAYR